MGLIEELILKRIENNENFLGSFVGGTGSGKTLAAIRMALSLDPEFNVDRIVLSAYDCLKLVHGGRLKPGSVVIYDESGVSTGNMDFQQKDVIMFTKVLQTFREENYILLFTMPSEGLLVKAARGLTHMRFRMVDKRLTKNKAYTIKIPEYNYNKAYYKGYSVAIIDRKVTNFKDENKFLYFNPKDERGNYIKYKTFELPPKRIIEPYLLKKIPFMKEVQRKAMEMALEKSPYAELTERQRETYEYHLQGMTQGEIADILGIEQPMVSKTLKAVKKKGYEVKNYSRNNLPGNQAISTNYSRNNFLDRKESEVELT